LIRNGARKLRKSNFQSAGYGSGLLLPDEPIVLGASAPSRQSARQHSGQADANVHKLLQNKNYADSSIDTAEDSEEGKNTDNGMKGSVSVD